MHGTEHMRKGEWKQYSCDIDTFFKNYEGYISSNDGPRANDKELKNLSGDLKRTAVKIENNITI